MQKSRNIVTRHSKDVWHIRVDPMFVFLNCSLMFGLSSINTSVVPQYWGRTSALGVDPIRLNPIWNLVIATVLRLGLNFE